MSDMNAHRKALATAIIVGAGCASWEVSQEHANGARLAFPGSRLQDGEEEEHGPCDTCIATGMFFPHDQDDEGNSIAAQCVSWSNVGPLWMGLWLGTPLYLHDGENEVSRAKMAAGYEDHGNTLFPRWLAEVLNELCELEIKDEDVYDV